MTERKKVTLDDVCGIISTEKIKGRFQEIISVEKIKDTVTGIEYDGLVDIELLKLINQIDESNELLKEQFDHFIGNALDKCVITNELQDISILLSEDKLEEAKKRINELIKEI